MNKLRLWLVKILLNKAGEVRVISKDSIIFVDDEAIDVDALVRTSTFALVVPVIKRPGEKIRDAFVIYDVQ